MMFKDSVISFIMWLQTTQDCGFFEWLDPPTTAWIKELLLDLKDVVDKLKSERGQPVVDEAREQHYQEVEQMNQCLQRQLVDMQAQLEAKDLELLQTDVDLVDKNEQLLMKDVELEALRKEVEKLKMNGRIKGCSRLFGFLCVFVVGMVVAMFFNGRAE